MPIRVLAVALADERDLALLADALVAPLAARDATVVAVGPIRSAGAGWLAVDPAAVGVAPDAPEVVALAAAAAGAFPRDVVVASPRGMSLATAGAACGVASIDVGATSTTDQVGEVLVGLDRIAGEEAAAQDLVGVGPHPAPWPDDPRLDPALLAAGDRRNVIDRYRYWSEAAIVADLDARRHPLHVAVENWRHDLNIGTVVRNANAFNVAAVHIVGGRRWNRRGAMATDRYLTVHHHADVGALATWAGERALPIVGIDNVPGARDLDERPLPASCVLLLGQEGPGLSPEARAACAEVVAIGQHGSTRSLNAGVASGIVLHAWVREHAPEPPAWPEAPTVP